MPLKKPDSKFGLSQSVWMVFVLMFLVSVFCFTQGCTSWEQKPDHPWRDGRFKNV